MGSVVPLSQSLHCTRRSLPSGRRIHYLQRGAGQPEGLDGLPSLLATARSVRTMTKFGRKTSLSGGGGQGQSVLVLIRLLPGTAALHQRLLWLERTQMLAA